MKASDAKGMPLSSMAKCINQVVNGKVTPTDDSQGLVIERALIGNERYIRFEIKKYKDPETGKILFSVDIDEGIKTSQKSRNLIRLKELQSLFITGPAENVRGEEKKATLLTMSDERFLVVDIDENLKVTSLSGYDKRKMEKIKDKEQPRRQFIEL